MSRGGILATWYVAGMLSLSELAILTDVHVDLQQKVKLRQSLMPGSRPPRSLSDVSSIVVR
jgi:hypothetical protein